MYFCIALNIALHCITILLCVIVYLMTKKRKKEELYYCSTDGSAEDEAVREVLRNMRKDYNRLNVLLVDQSQEDERDKF